MPEEIIMENVLKEEIKALSEIIGRAEELINENDDSLGYLIRKDLVDRLYGMKPACFMKLRPIGRDTSGYLFPVCNRHGIEDPKVITLSIKMINKIMLGNDPRFDNNDMQKLLNDLQHKHDSFIERVPKPMSIDAKKAKMARMFDNIRKYLTLSKTGTL